MREEKQVIERDEVKKKVALLLQRASDLADEPLEGIEEAAHLLATMADGDARVISEARRVAELQSASSATPHDKQVSSLIRRAIEVGMSRWGFEETKPVP